jgi:hypothetical protein
LTWDLHRTTFEMLMGNDVGPERYVIDDDYQLDAAAIDA